MHAELLHEHPGTHGPVTLEVIAYGPRCCHLCGKGPYGKVKHFRYHLYARHAVLSPRQVSLGVERFRRENNAWGVGS